MNNPCKKCVFCFLYKNRCYPSYSPTCKLCEKRKEYEKYKKSNRMFSPGDVITTLDELLQQDWVIWSDRTRHIEVIKNLQLNCVLRLLKGGNLRIAVRKENKHESN